MAWSPSGELQSLKLTVGGTTTELDPSGFTHQHTWTPSAFGTYTIIAEASDGTNTSADTCVFDFTKFNPDICGHPLWNKDSVYKDAGTQVSWDGNIYQNKWWTKGDEPGTGAPWDNPWTYLGQCPAGVGLPEFPADPVSHAAVTVYPNPVRNGICTIRVEQTTPETDLTYCLKDQTGRLVAGPVRKACCQPELIE